MPNESKVDVSIIIERQKLTPFLIQLVTMSWAITFFDGLDANLISFAAPYFRSEYNLSPVQVGNIFSMHQIGTLVGGFLLAFVGDIIGRRPSVIISTAAFGLCTMTFYFASSYDSLLVLRFINGIPLGGMLPLAWALNIEYAPTRYRATIVTMIMIGYSVGTALGGPIANWVVPRFGWKALFVFGGIAGIVSALFLLWRLPESIRFLAVRRRHPTPIADILKRLEADIKLPPNAEFVVKDEPNHSSLFTPSLLFRGKLRYITPLVWLAYIASSFAVFFLVNWTPLVFESLGFSREQAANASAMNSIMGAIGGLVLMRFTDIRGASAITPMPVACAALMLLTGLALPNQVFLTLIALIGFFLIGGHFGMHSVAGIFYPTMYRGNGAGWATSVAKIGSIGGPIIGGWLLATKIPVGNIFALLAICPMIFAICIFAVGKIHRGTSNQKRDETQLNPQELSFRRLWNRFPVGTWKQ